MSAAEARPGASVLVVDDELNMRRTLAEILRDEGYEVTTAASGEEALELCTRRPPDIVLLDVRMPGIDGVEVLRRIRSRREATRFILMSAFSVDELRHAAPEEGAVAILPKPLDLNQVLKLMAGIQDSAVLVAGSDPSTADALDRGLRERGYRVTVAPSPRGALELIEQIRFDLAFIDVQQPANSGLDLYLALREAAPRIVAIMVTGDEHGGEELAREAIRRTAYALVRKPLDMAEIESLLNRISGQRASRSLRKPPTPD